VGAFLDKKQLLKVIFKEKESHVTVPFVLFQIIYQEVEWQVGEFLDNMPLLRVVKEKAVVILADFTGSVQSSS
jgi:hypothetical protein